MKESKIDNLSLAKQEIKLLDYIPGTKSKKGRFTFINPCPICGHNDHFAVDNKNQWVTFSGCHNKYKGGSIVQYLCEVEWYDEKTAINKVLEMTGRQESKIDFAQIQKDKVEKEFLKNQYIKQKTIINKCYHKLCIMLRALEDLKYKNAFLNWLYNFLDNYTDMYIYADTHKEKYDLCLNFKTELHYSYMNFLSFETALNEILNQKKEDILI